MNNTAVRYKGLYYSSPIESCVLSVADLQKLHTHLVTLAHDAVVAELLLWRRLETQSAEDFEKIKSDLLAKDWLLVTILGSGGQQLVGLTADVLANDKLPDVIQRVIFDSNAEFRVTHNQDLQNRFFVVLDFKETPNLNLYNPWDAPTPNDSRIEISGPNETWVTGVRETVRGFIQHRKKTRRWFHSVLAYNLGYYLLGIPIALWIAYRMDGVLATRAPAINSALRGAFDIYFFLVGAFVFRFIIGLIRWLFPVIELEGARSGRWRAAGTAFVVALFTAFAYDVLKALF